MSFHRATRNADGRSQRVYLEETGNDRGGYILFTVVAGLGVRVEYPLPPLQLGFLHGNRALDGRNCCGEFLVVRGWLPFRAIVAM